MFRGFSFTTVNFYKVHFATTLDCPGPRVISQYTTVHALEETQCRRPFTVKFGKRRLLPNITSLLKYSNRGCSGYNLFCKLPIYQVIYCSVVRALTAGILDSRIHLSTTWRTVLSLIDDAWLICRRLILRCYTPEKSQRTLLLIW